MSDVHPIGDQVKVKLDSADPHGFSDGESKSTESGILVEMSAIVAWLGYHSFAFESSLGDGKTLEKIFSEYKKLLLNKRVYWESMQDSGRRIKEGGDEFVLLKLTDIIAYSEPDVKATTVTDVRRTGSFRA